ncbi:MAG TPA: AraC family transcriptional regulator [Polyangiaceae bacterium]|nr:AraC family transcriptional regulator [Polyangiaceae bacterium]
MTQNGKPNGPTAWARIAHLFLDFGARRGVRRADLLDATGLGEAALGDPDGRIPLACLYDLVEAIGQATGDPAIGLEMPLGLEVDALDVLGFLFITSATFGDALGRMLRYQRIWNEGERIDLRVDGERVRMTYDPFGPFRPAHVLMAQAAICDFAVNTPRFVPGVAFESCHFRHTRPNDPSRYESVLKLPVEFSAAHDEVRFARSMLDVPIPDANAMLCAFFERHASEKLSELPGAAERLVDRLRRLIRRQLPDGGVKAADLAPKLHMSPRTLQRRLQDEGTSLQAELDRVRRQQALYFLENGTAIAELSWLLGYAEPSAFHHAFKRWTGTSPEAWRAARKVAT